MCRVPIYSTTSAVPGTVKDDQQLSKLNEDVVRLQRKAFPNIVCCSDYDVFFSSEGTPWVGRPEGVAGRLWNQSLLHLLPMELILPLKSAFMSTAEQEIATITVIAAAIVGQQIPDIVFRAVAIVLPRAKARGGGPAAAAGPRHVNYDIAQPLADIVEAFADALLWHHYFTVGDAGRHHKWGPRTIFFPTSLSAASDSATTAKIPLWFIHASLELKITEPAVANGGIPRPSDHSLHPAVHRISKVIMSAGSNVYAARVNTTTSMERLHGNDDRPFISPAMFLSRLVQRFSVIVDPILRFPSIQPKLLSGAAEDFLPYLETRPHQLMFSLPLLDRYLPPVADLLAGGAALGSAQKYCGLVTSPPVWAADTMPSLKFLQYCTAASPRLAAPLLQVKSVEAMTVPINVWLIDSKADCANAVSLQRQRQVDGGISNATGQNIVSHALLIQSVVSNFPQRAAHCLMK